MNQLFIRQTGKVFVNKIQVIFTHKIRSFQVDISYHVRIDFFLSFLKKSIKKALLQQGFMKGGYT